MLSLLNEDVILVSDGVGKVIAATSPIQTRDRVARILLDGFGRIQGKLHIEAASLNGEKLND
ncbi:hypothetical protein [Paenibacillus phytorum]|uniref:hypothetical protein n=1 Tax=Paenibacillus phytorum TaxID=2654977 RepID=UPI0035E45145